MLRGDREVAIAAKRAALKAFGARLQEARGSASVTQEEVASKLEVSTQTIRNWEAGRTEPRRLDKERLAKLYDKPVEWFVGGEEELQQARPAVKTPYCATQPLQQPVGIIVSLEESLRGFNARFDRLDSSIRAMSTAEPRAEYAADNRHVEVRHVEVRQIAASAGGGATVWDETVTGYLAFQRAWLDRNAIDPTQCTVITVRGESMEPTLPDGCSILVDLSQRGRREGRIYVIRTDDGLVVKRAGRGEDGRWQIVSDHPGWEVAAWVNDTEIIGEVLWAARTFRSSSHMIG